MATKNPYAQFGPTGESNAGGAGGAEGAVGSGDPVPVGSGPGRRLDPGWTGGKPVDLSSGRSSGGPAWGGGGDSGGWGGPGEGGADAGPKRTSILAILSLVCALVCFLPGLGALAMLLGGAALVSIRVSGGRKGGTGLAVGGIALGLIVTVLWSACMFGGLLFVREMGQLMASLPAAQAHDADGVRAHLAPGVTVTDEQVQAFGEALTAAHGGYVDLPQGVVAYVLGMSRSPGAMGLAAEGQRVYGAGSQVMVMPVEFDRGTVGVVVVVNSGPPVKMFNIGFEDRGTAGGVVWLLPPPGSGQAGP